jgi:hypothetical protein
MKISKLKVPIVLHILYILFTLSINLLGPKVYSEYDNKLGMVIFIILYLISIYCGYCAGLKSKIKVNYKDYYNGTIDNKINSLTTKCIKISCLLFIVNTIYMIMSGRFTLDLAMMGANYNSFYEYYREKTQSNLFTFENIFLLVSAIPQFIATCLGIFCYKNLSKSNKRIFIAFLALIVCNNTISNGNQKSIGDIVIFFLISMVYTMYKYPSLKQKIKKRIYITTFAFLILMSFSQMWRMDSSNIETVNVLNKKMSGYVKFDPEHPIFKIFGERVGLGISSFLTGYLSNGYYGLSKSLELPFEWSYGVGNSVGLSTIVEKSVNVDPYQKTYLGRMEKNFKMLGIDGKRNWHTIFPWLASDLTFFGTLVFFYIISYIYAKSWKEALIYDNKVSYLMFSLLTIMFIFVPANNQIFHGYNYIVVTLFIFLYWGHSHSKFNHVKQIS